MHRAAIGDDALSAEAAYGEGARAPEQYDKFLRLPESSRSVVPSSIADSRIA
jgi:hypothetical protein